MRILVLGRNGMLGHVVYEYFKSIGEDVFGTDIRGNGIVYDAYKNQDEFENIVKEYKPEVVINCIGILNQVAEDNKVLAVKLNSLLPHYVDSLSEKYNFKFIHVSTDCVFDGKKGKYDEDALPDATSFYGRSKALGEVVNNRSITLRTSIVGPDTNPNGIGLFQWFMNQKGEVGGYTKVFEIARCFRNEGIDATHLQDFTMIEGYGAYLNYRDNMKFLREMLQSIIMNIFGTLEINVGDKVVDLSGEWEDISFRDLILKYSDIDINVYNTKELLLQKIREDKIEIDSETPLENLGYGNLVDQLYKKIARPYIINPVFLTKHPISLSPLARANDSDPTITDRFQLVINGAEIINAYSELVDPIEQEKRLLEQARLKANGDEESMPMDYDYIDAMEYGMPPISGWGMGIDRLVQLLTNSANIKDVVLFPLMKNKEDITND